MSAASSAGGTIKLSCRQVWKVYGDSPERHFADRKAPSDDPLEVARRLRAEGQIVAAADVSFDVGAGETFVIMGLSGSGKSTVVRCLSRLIEPTAGEVLLDGYDLLGVSEHELIEIRRHKMGMVFQGFGLLPHLNVLDNIAFPLKMQGITRRERYERAMRVIELVGLDGRESSFPYQLSGGQQQRVGIARSLAVEPDLWLLDEPFSALDPLIRRQMQDEFLRIQRVLKKSIVFITHDFLEALRIADRMVIMRDGGIIQMGTPGELVTHPSDDYVAEFTRDVPVARVLTAGSIARAVDLPAGDLPRIAASEPLEVLLPVLAKHVRGVCVIDESGGAIGMATAQDVVAALASGIHPAACASDSAA